MARLLLSFVATASALSLDEQWMSYLNTPPAASVTAMANLTARAERIAATITGKLALSGDLDVVVSGGGNYDAYLLGAYTVLLRASAGGERFRMERWAGASAGGMAPFELMLKGEETTLVTHHAYGMLEEEWPLHYALAPSCAALQDHHWRAMAAWQSERWNASLHTLDDRVYLATSCLTPLPTLVKVHKYTSQSQATSAFMSTGTFAEWYDGHLCSDGGATSGPKMTPLFQDGVRPQLIIDLMACGFPISMAEGKYTSTQFVALAQRGQDDAAAFLRNGSAPAARSGAITLCPRGADVSGNVCVQP